jgi:acyl dehydratase
VKDAAGPQSPYDIEDVRRSYIGFETAQTKGRYPVEYDAIRRHCHMVDDNNPLFLDPEYAKTTSHEGVIWPPSGWLALYFGSLGPALPRRSLRDRSCGYVDVVDPISNARSQRFAYILT